MNLTIRSSPTIARKVYYIVWEQMAPFLSVWALETNYKMNISVVFLPIFLVTKFFSNETDGIKINIYMKLNII